MSYLLPKAISFNSNRERSLQVIGTQLFSLSKEPQTTEEQNLPLPCYLPNLLFLYFNKTY